MKRAVYNMASVYNGRGDRRYTNAIDLGGGVGEIACDDCFGTGRFQYDFPNLEKCNVCKGTGRVKAMICLPHGPSVVASGIIQRKTIINDTRP